MGLYCTEDTKNAKKSHTFETHFALWSKFKPLDFFNPGTRNYINPKRHVGANSILHWNYSHVTISLVDTINNSNSMLCTTVTSRQFARIRSVVTNYGGTVMHLMPLSSVYVVVNVPNPLRT